MAFDAELGKQLKFSDEDLEFNRRGELSPAQRRKLKFDGYVSAAVLSLIIGSFIVIGVVGLFIQWLAGLFTLGIAGAMGYIGWKIVRQALGAKTVQSYTGQIKSVRVLHRAGNIIHTDQYNFHIAYRTFLVPNLSGKTFTFYFVTPQLLLSVEEVINASLPPHPTSEQPPSNAEPD